MALSRRDEAFIYFVATDRFQTKSVNVNHYLICSFIKKSKRINMTHNMLFTKVLLTAWHGMDKNGQGVTHSDTSAGVQLVNRCFRTTPRISPKGQPTNAIVETTTTTTVLGANHDVAHKAPTSTLRYDTAGNGWADVTSVITTEQPCREIEKGNLQEW